MSKSLPSKDTDAIKIWPLPEFGLLSHAHHTTHKKLKAKSIVNNTLQKQQFENEYANGLKKGYDEGYKKASLEMSKKIEQMSKLIIQLEQYKNNIDINFRKNVYEFISMICEKIVLEKMSTSSEAMTNIIKRGLELIDCQSTSLKIFCNDELFNTLGADKTFIDNKQIILEKDDKIPDFSFRIESDKQFLEFNLKASLANIINESKELFIGPYK